MVSLDPGSCSVDEVFLASTCFLAQATGPSDDGIASTHWLCFGEVADEAPIFVGTLWQSTVAELPLSSRIPMCIRVGSSPVPLCGLGGCVKMRIANRPFLLFVTQECLGLS